MRYSTVKRSLGNTCRRCINRRYKLNLTPEDCFYYRYKDECHRCHRMQNIVTDIGSRWKLWRTLPLAMTALALFVLLILGLRTVDVARIRTSEAGSIPLAASAAESAAEGAERIGLSSLNLAVHRRMGVHLAVYRVTEWLGYAAILIAAAFAVYGAIQLFRRGLRGVDPEILALGGLYAATIAVYVFFEFFVVNTRPVLLNGGLQASFPSSHTMIACVVFGSAAMVITRMRIPALTLWVVALQVLTVLTAAGRPVSGVHWFTDILGGVLISTALLAGFAAVLKAVTGARE